MIPTPEIFRIFEKYDRSGRSSGIAIISFESPMEATRAKRQFDGILAKGKHPACFLLTDLSSWCRAVECLLSVWTGQPISIIYDNTPTPAARGARRAASAPSSLLQRIQKAPLLERLGQDDTSVKGYSEPYLSFRSFFRFANAHQVCPLQEGR
jgi:THO complex subunit 4